MVVLKFGGTSVGSAEAIQRVARIVARETRPRVVVVSALSGVTDRLLAIAALRTRHLDVAMDVVPAAALKALTEYIDAGLDCVERAADRLLDLGHRDPSLVDTIAVQGELLSSRLVVFALQAADIPAAWV